MRRKPLKWVIKGGVLYAPIGEATLAIERIERHEVSLRARDRAPLMLGEFPTLFRAKRFCGELALYMKDE